MNNDLRVSEACQKLARNLRVYEDKGVGTVFAEMISVFGRNKVTRAIQNDGVCWEPELVEHLARTYSCHAGIDKQEVMDHLLDGTVRTNAELVAMMTADLFFERASNIGQMMMRLNARLRGAKLIRAVNGILPGRHVPEFVEGEHVRAWKEDTGRDSEAATAQWKFFDHQRTDFFDRHDDTIEYVMAMRRSAMQSLQARQGAFRYYGEGDPFETFESLRYDAVDDRNVQVLEVDDTSDAMPNDVRSWLEGLDGALSIDDQFVMLVLNGGKYRRFIDRGTDERQNKLLDAHLKMINASLSHLSHERSKAGSRSMLQGYLDGKAD